MYLNLKLQVNEKKKRFLAPLSRSLTDPHVVWALAQLNPIKLGWAKPQPSLASFSWAEAQPIHAF